MKHLLKKEYFSIVDDVFSWEESIQRASAPLIKEEVIKLSYVESMINNVKRFGPYIVIIPHIAFAHAEPNRNVFKNSIAILSVKKGVKFNSDNDPVKMILVIAAKTKEDHINIFSKLSQIFIDADCVDQLLRAETYEKVYEILNHKGGNE